MSFAHPTGSRFLFFTALPFVLVGIAAFTFPLPGRPGAPPLSAVLFLDGVLALSLLVLWPYHRLRVPPRLLAGMTAGILVVLLASLVVAGVSELSSPLAIRKLLLGPVLLGTPATLCGWFALRGRLPRAPVRWGRRGAPGGAEVEARELAAREQARASWPRFLERRPSARAASVLVRLRGPSEDGLGPPVCVPDDEHPNPIEFRRAIRARMIWGEVLEAGPESVRIQLRSVERALVVGTCEARPCHMLDWELVMRDGTIEGGYGLRGLLASQNELRLPGRLRRRLRRLRPV